MKQTYVCRSICMVLAMVFGASIILTGCAAGSSGATSEIGGLTELETNVFDSGPVDMPVTISKLTAPSSDSVTVTPVDATLTDCPDGESILFQITGSSGAISDATIAPLVFVYNETTDTQSIQNVESDGSFSFSICAESEDTINLAAMSSDRAHISPTLGIKRMTNGNLLRMRGNSNGSSELFKHFVDSASNQYLVAVDEDGFYNLVRICNDSANLELIVANNVAPIKQAVINGTVGGYIESNGKIYTLVTSGNGECSDSPTTSNWTSTLVETITITDNDSPINEELSMFLANNQLIVRKSQNFATNGQLIDVIDIATSTVTSLFSTDDYVEAIIDVTPQEQMYMALSPLTNSWVIRKVDVSTIRATTLDENELLASSTLIQDGYLGGLSRMHANDNNQVVVLNENTNDTTAINLITDEGTTTNIKSTGETTFYDEPKLSSGGEYIIACNKNITDDTVLNQLYIFRPSLDTADEWVQLTSFTDRDACSNSRTDSFVINGNDDISVITYLEESTAIGMNLVHFSVREIDDLMNLF